MIVPERFNKEAKERARDDDDDAKPSPYSLFLEKLRSEARNEGRKEGYALGRDRERGLIVPCKDAPRWLLEAEAEFDADERAAKNVS